MLIAYVLRGLYGRFVLTFGVLVFVLATADVLMRLGQLQAAAFVPELFIYAIPVIALFALPIAASFAVQTQLASWYASSAIVLVRSLSGMQRMLRSSLLFFSLSLGLCYVPLVFDVAPRSASAGRSMVLSFAKEHLRKLEPNAMHQLGNGSLVFFRGKREQGEALLFNEILIRFRDAHGSQVLSAQEGAMHGDRLYLYNGTMHSESTKQISASFGRMHLDLNRVLGNPASSAKQPKASHLSWAELGKQIFSDSAVTLEFHTRLVRLLWLLIFPFLALSGIAWFGEEGHMRLTHCLSWSAGTFLVSYVLISVASALAGVKILAYLLLYGGSGALWLGLLRLGRGRW